MALTTDPNDPCLINGRKEEGQNNCYLVLSQEQRDMGFVRPVRDKYVHVGIDGHEIDPEDKSKHGLKGRGCGALTSMPKAIAETYARDPKFYSATFCCGCNTHLPVAEFTWDGTNERVGS